jgi:hypothetical protein
MAAMERLSGKQMSVAWEISVTKTSQARDGAFRKFALALSLFPKETTADLACYMAAVPAELEQRQRIFEAELPRRVARQQGRGEDPITMNY